MLPEMMLDDVRFQELVSEARTRIVRYSPGWTEHNVSDPGITLIELVAWFTEILSYRINRIPDRLQLALLELIGVRPAPPRQATVELRFMLDEPIGGSIPAGTEVASPRIAGGDLVVFQTDHDLAIPTGSLAAYAVQRGSKASVVEARAGAAEPAGEARLAFGEKPAPGSAFLVGFDQPLAGLVVRLEIESSRAGTRGETDPPLRWEASAGGGDWHEADVVEDETQGLSLGGGVITVEVPQTAGAVSVGGRSLHWIRARVVEPAAGGPRAGYTSSPEVTRVRAAIVGATVVGTHAGTVRQELLGPSEGIPGIAYRLQHRPVLPLTPAETLEVRDVGQDEWVPWRQVESFAMSGPGDRHFQLDLAAGEIRFGPAIRQPDGGWRHYGMVPPAGAALRISYRHGGGTAGNVAARTLRILRPAIPGVAGATNPRPASGGGDAESLESATERARVEIRSRSRAVTTEDFERLTLAASGEVARAICVAPPLGAPVRVHVLPRVAPADRQLSLEELTPSERLMETLAAALDRRRLLGTSIRLAPVRLRGISVVADVRASPLSDLERVQQDVEHALYVFLNPLIGGSPTGPGEGWPAGRALNPGELFGIVYAIEGVEFVNVLRMYETDLTTGQQAAQPTDSQLVLAPDELIASGKHIIKAMHRE